MKVLKRTVIVIVLSFLVGMIAGGLSRPINNFYVLLVISTTIGVIAGLIGKLIIKKWDVRE